VWKPLIESGILAPLTSVVPSTTCSSLTTLWTGRSPASHGIIGYEMWLKDYALVANMILHSPITFKDETPGSLKKAGFSPQHFLGLPTLGSHLMDNGVRSFAFSHYSITNSGLSQMLMKDVEVHPFQTPASLWVSIRQLLETQAADKMYIWAYWGQLDSISHHYGPDDERAAAEFSHFSAAFEHFFLSPLDTRPLQDTLVILISDHGQTYTPLDSRNLIKHHPLLNQYLLLNPTCENRFASLYLRPGTEDLVREYFKSRFPDRFTLISQEEALQADLFGPGLRHPDLIHRLGDLIAIAHENAYLWWSDQEDFLLGRHGSLHPDDMIVPFLAARL
jgi:predicted AlkP superfamily pyrophosphatase or phosphodiesterase